MVVELSPRGFQPRIGVVVRGLIAAWVISAAAPTLAQQQPRSEMLERARARSRLVKLRVEAPAAPADAARYEQILIRNYLVREIDQAIERDRPQDASAALDRLAALTDDDDSSRVALENCLERLASACENQQDFDAALAFRKRLHAVIEGVHGTSDWRTFDSRLQVERSARIASLSAAQVADWQAAVAAADPMAVYDDPSPPGEDYETAQRRRDETIARNQQALRARVQELFGQQSLEYVRTIEQSRPDAWSSGVEETNQWYEDFLAVLRSIYPQGHPVVAENLVQWALNLSYRAYAPPHPANSVESAEEVAAAARLHQMRTDVALRASRAILDDLNEADRLPTDRLWTCYDLIEGSSAELRRSGQFEKSAQVLADGRIDALAERLQGPDSWQAADARQIMAEARRIAALDEQAQDAVRRELAAWQGAAQHANAGEFALARRLLDEVIISHQRTQPNDAIFAADASHLQALIALAEANVALPYPSYEIRAAVGMPEGSERQRLAGAQWDMTAVARRHFRDALRVRADRLHNSHPATLESLRNLVQLDATLAGIAEHERDENRTRALWDEIIDTLSTVCGAENWRTREARFLADSSMARCRMSDEDRARAEETRQLLAKSREFVQHNRYRDAVSAAGEAFERFLAAPGFELESLDAAFDQAWMLADLGRSEEVFASLNSLTAVLTPALTVDNPVLAEVTSRYAWTIRDGLNEPLLATLIEEQYRAAVEASQRGRPPEVLAVPATDGDERPVLTTSVGWSGRDTRSGVDFETPAQAFTHTLYFGLETISDEQIRTLDLAIQAEVAYGNYAAAIPLAEQLVGRAATLYGETSDAYARALANSASLNLDVGDYQLAEERFLAVKVILETQEPAPSMMLGRVINNLGVLATRVGRWGDAEAFFTDAVAHMRASELADEIDRAQADANLAVVLHHLGRQAEASELLAGAIDSLEQSLGDDDPIVAFFRIRRTVSLIAEGKLDAADRLLAQASESYQASDVSDLLVDIELDHVRALLAAEQGDEIGAAAAARAALALADKFFRNAIGICSERQQIAVAEAMKGELDLLLSVVAPDELAGADDYGAILSWKGALQAGRIVRNIDQYGYSPTQFEDEGKFEQAAQLAAELADAAARGPSLEVMGGISPGAQGDSEPDPAMLRQWEQNVRTMAEKLELASRDLAPQFLPPATDLPPAAELCRRLQSSLEPGEALVDYYVYTPASTEIRLPEEGRDPRHVKAFVVKRDRIACHELGSVEPVTSAARQWRDTFGGPTADGSPKPAAVLRSVLWAPLEAEVADARIVVISPDGPLHDVAFGALPGQSKPYLIQEKILALSAAPQAIPDLLAAPERPVPWIELGGPLAFEFGLAMPAAPPAAATGDLAGEPETGASRGDQQQVMLLFAPVEFGLQRESAADSIVAELRSGFLPSKQALARLAPVLRYTDDEVSDLSDLFEQANSSGIAVLRRRNLATKKRFCDEITGATWVHVATHAVFMRSEALSGRQLATTHRLARSAGPLLRHDLGVKHPGLTTGLMLAAEQPADEPGSFSFLSAAELAALDLRHVDMMVFSACDTALGERLYGEGLASLQRAAHMAGVRTVVATQWAVDDRQARDLMQLFYENILIHGLPKAEALQRAQIEILESLSRGGDPPESGPVLLSPRFWGGFVLSGNWRSTVP